jgi:3-hydroxyisobutyrate dehydrogenase-like beta-hydroxyacid dehydrogenase
MNLALQAASSYTTPLVLGVTAKEVYENVAQRTDFAHRDFSVVYQALKVAADAKSAKKKTEASASS